MTQFSIPKPIDMFANDFLRFLSRKVEIVGDRNVKVLYCGESFWSQLHPLQKTSGVFKPNESVRRPSTKTLAGWQRVNGWIIQPVGQLEDGSLIWSLTPEERVIGFRDFGLEPALAQELSLFDAVIFLNQRNLLNAVRNGRCLPNFLVVAHEVFHVVERLSGGRLHMSTWDADRDIDAPEVLECFYEFVKGSGAEAFGS
jgi:hypothetical protein